jgi:hypothetical protein
LRRLFACCLYTNPGKSLFTLQQYSDIFPDMSSPLLRYHDENTRRAHRSMPHSFPEKYLGDNSEKGFLRHIAA